MQLPQVTTLLSLASWPRGRGGVWPSAAVLPRVYPNELKLLSTQKPARERLRQLYPRRPHVGCPETKMPFHR